MRILRVTPFPPEHVGGLPLYCKNISVNLLERKNIISDILTTDLSKSNKKK